jgi:hypothetical protein
MTPPRLHPTPRLREVLREQVRVVGLALRLPAAVAAALFVAATVLAAADAVRGGGALGFHPQQLLLPGLAGLLLPVGVWMGEDRFGGGFFWTLPVDRSRHALARVCAGWVWLMAAVAFFVLWLLALALLSGARPMAVETLRLLPAFSVPDPVALDPRSLRMVPWTPEPLLWLVPFTAATAAYLLASALALGSRHPLWWIVGSVLGVFVLSGVADATGSRWLLDEPPRVLRSLFLGPYGLDSVLSARTELLKVGTTLTTGEKVVVWRGLPDVGHWAAATLLWTGAGLLALWAASSRHRERRRR